MFHISTLCNCDQSQLLILAYGKCAFFSTYVLHLFKVLPGIALKKNLYLDCYKEDKDVSFNGLTAHSGLAGLRIQKLVVHQL